MSEFLFDTSLLDDLPVAIGIADSEGKINYFNNHFSTLFGYTVKDVPNMEIWLEKAYPNETYRQWALNIWVKEIEDENWTGVKVIQQEFQLSCKNGDTKTVEISFNKKDNYLLTFFRDISEIAESREEISSEKKFTEKIIDSLPGNFYLFKQHSDGFKLIRWNTTFQKTLGYHDSEMKDMPPNHFITENHHEKSNDLIKNMFNKGYVETELNIMTKDGTEVPYYITGAPFYDKNNIYFLGMGYDISRQKQIETELKISREKAIEGEKLKSAFLANMSHEIRTPLNGILGFSGLLDNEDLPPEDRRYYIDVINQSSNQLLSIVDDILSISKMETGQMEVTKEEVFINGLLEEISTVYKPKANHKNILLSLNLELSDEKSVVLSDSDKLKQIIDNLLSNAIKFTHKGHVLLGYSLKDNYLEFYIEDTGIGISQDHHSKIFERFQQVDSESTRVYGGTGLGLTIAKGNCELFGGKIWVESTLGEGTKFSFTIPYEPVYQEEIVKEPEMENDRTTILIAEDEEINFLYLEESLKDFNYTILRARDGIEAVELCKNTPSINLVLMDIKMPNMDGYKAFEEIRKIRPELPVIAQTAYAMLSDREMALKAGFKAYLSKPIKTSSLLETIDKHLS